MTTEAELAERFNRRLSELFATARNVVPFLAVRNLPTLGPDDGLPLAHHILASPMVTQAFEELWAAASTEFTPEWLVVQEQYAPLFTPREIDVARRRLGMEPLLDVTRTAAEDTEERLRRRLLDLCDIAKRELRYEPARFRALVEDRGGVEAVRAVIAQPALLGALAEFADAGRADLRVEACVLESEYQPLFTSEEVAVVRGRLRR